MIDTDKYEGHGPAPWKWERNHIFCTTEYKGEKRLAAIAQWVSTRIADAELMADAPLLLAEVKRLREIEREWKQMWSKLEDYPDMCAELICFMESEEE